MDVFVDAVEGDVLPVYQEGWEFGDFYCCWQWVVGIWVGGGGGGLIHLWLCWLIFLALQNCYIARINISSISPYKTTLIPHRRLPNPTNPHKHLITNIPTDSKHNKQTQNPQHILQIKQRPVILFFVAVLGDPAFIVALGLGLFVVVVVGGDFVPVYVLV